MVKILTIQNTLIKIHPLFYLFAFIAILTGLFHDFLIFTSIILIHELGHVFAGICMKCFPEKILILPFGGLTIFKMPINISINKELFIAMMGPITQIIFSLIFFKGETYQHFHLFILLFNLLPIYPLDGMKILNCLINKLSSFKKAFFLSLYISFVCMSFLVILIFYQKFNLGWIIILFFLILKCIEEFKNFPNIFNKFLYERYTNNFKFKKIKIVNSLFSMKRDYEHIFKIEKNLRKEKEVLQKRFDFKRIL